MLRASVVLALLGLLAIVGCDDSPDTCLPDCTANRDYDAVAYALRGELAWERRELIATEDITVALAGGPVIELDARVAIERVTADGTELGYAADRDRGLLRVDLAPIAGDEPVTFTVAYRAVAGAGLVFAGPRDDDPVASRVAYTNSEPDDARTWLVSNDRPADRATFAVELVVDADEDVIANGERLSDGSSGSRRVVRHAIEEPIPTYLMAFAAGQLEHQERTDGRVPLALWYRRGAAVNVGEHLALVARQLAHFESLLGPYPFDRYAVVLIPGFPGGMENATITFNSESSGQGAISESLNAHELAHQWFGDWVTMRDYRDVWFKEGMATLLAAEASRPQRDAEQRGRLFGSVFNFDPNDAIIDDSLTSMARYTTGPYERAAWTLTQVRARVGEAAFWGSLREVLANHALDSVDTETFVRSFAPELDEPTIARWLGVLDDKGAPRVSIDVAGSVVTLALSDAAGLLFDSIPLTVVDGAGNATARSLAPGAPLVIDVPTGGYLAPDERDIHPYWNASFEVVPSEYAELAPVIVPAAAGARTAFATRSAATQERALASSELPGITPATLRSVHDALDSAAAKRGLVVDACRTLANLPTGSPDIAAWASALAPLLANPAQPQFTNQHAVCARAVPATQLASELAALAAQGAAIPASSLARLEYLLGFDYGAAASLASIAAIATSAPSIRHRDLALDRLGQQARSPYSRVADADLPAYRSFFRERLTSVTSGTRLLILWRGIGALRDVEALPAVGALLQKVPLASSVERRIVCEAYALAGPSDAWVAFQNAAKPWSSLSMEAAAALANPAACPR